MNKSNNTDFLEQRLGRRHAKQRLGIEADKKQSILGNGINFFHPENWYSSHRFIKAVLLLSGMYSRGVRNARKMSVKRNQFLVPGLPQSFSGFTLLHLSDLHVDMDWHATTALIETIKTLEYDLCVLTGDYRAQTYGGIDETLRGMQMICDTLKTPIFGVLGNHDSVRMLPGLENMGITMLMNESYKFELGSQHIYLAGVDDPHYYRVDNIEKAAQEIPHDHPSILLCHTPEVFKQAAYADFNVMLCGHTHGGQICLPGGFPITLDSKCPRYVGAGPWTYQSMLGYTSVGSGTSIVNVRFNCPPEVCLHTLHPA